MNEFQARPEVKVVPFLKWKSELPDTGDKINGIVKDPDGQEGFYQKTDSIFTFWILGEGQDPGELLIAIKERHDLWAVNKDFNNPKLKELSTKITSLSKAKQY
jgi:hypothetical protein